MLILNGVTKVAAGYGRLEVKGSACKAEKPPWYPSEGTPRGNSGVSLLCGCTVKKAEEPTQSSQDANSSLDEVAAFSSRLFHI